MSPQLPEPLAAIERREVWYLGRPEWATLRPWMLGILHARPLDCSASESAAIEHLRTLAIDATHLFAEARAVCLVSTYFVGGRLVTRVVETINLEELRALIEVARLLDPEWAS